MIREKKLRVLDANLLYFVGAMVLLTLGGYLQRKHLMSGLIITQYGLILLPPLLYLLARKINIKKTLRFNKISLKHGFFVALITILMYPTAVFANAFLLFLLSLLGNLNVPQIPMAQDLNQYVILMLIVSVRAGICEEVLFRGFILSGYEALGKKKAIIISSILFGFFHFNIYNLFGPMVLGLVFAYLVTLTDSIFAGMIGHIVNNGFAVSLGFIGNLLSNKLNMAEAATSSPEVSTTVAMLVGMVFSGILAIGFGFLAYVLARVIKQDLQLATIEATGEPSVEEEEEEYILRDMNKTKSYEFYPLWLTIPLFLMAAGSQIMEIIRLG